MPFPYQTSATPVRTRKPLRERDKDREKDKERDKDARSITSSSSRRHREASRSSNRSPLPSSSSGPSSLYTQTNVTSDQLQALPRSETASPSSAKSPILRASSVLTATSVPTSSTGHPYTPAALQPYLETDDDEDLDNVATPQASSTNHSKPYFDAELVKTSSNSQPIISTSGPSPPPSAVAAAAKLPSIHSPPTSPLALSRVSTRSSDPSSNLQHPRPLHVPASPPNFTPVLPYFGGPPTEQYFPHPPGPPQYYTMAQAVAPPLDLQGLPPANFYQPYTSPPQVPGSFDSLRSPPAREQDSSSSRMSFSGDPISAITSVPMTPADSVLAPESAGTHALISNDMAMLERLKRTLPDLEQLMTRYEHTSGKLGEREVALRQTEAEKNKVLEEKDAHIVHLRKEVQEVSSNLTQEMNKLRLEVNNLTDKKVEAEERLTAEVRRRGESEKKVEELRAECTTSALKFESEKTKMMQEHAARIQTLLDKNDEHTSQQQEQIRKAEILQAEITALNEQHAHEKAMLEKTRLKREQELEDDITKLKRDNRDAKTSHNRTLDELEKKHEQERQAWGREREMLSESWESEKAKVGPSSEGYQGMIKEHADTTADLQRNIEKLKAGWSADRDRLTKLTADLKDTTEKLKGENSRLQGLAVALEQVTDLKGRGDDFYHDKIELLQRQILDLAREFCSSSSAHRPPDALIQGIPSGLPHFFVDTPASAQLRVAYVQSLISGILVREVLEPFLFTERRVGNLLNDWGESMRSKSTKREAIWRQRTLQAAFSGDKGRSDVNELAARIINEIYSAVKFFADQDKRDQLKKAIRNIVSTTAGTWRYARIELSRIVVSLAPNGPCKQTQEPLLTMFPRIEREPMPKELRLGKKADKGCVYSRGEFLTTSSPAVIARRRELGEVASPTVTDGEEGEEGELRASSLPQSLSSSSEASPEKTLEPRTTSPLIPPPLNRSMEARKRDVSDERFREVLATWHERERGMASLGHTQDSSGEQSTRDHNGGTAPHEGIDDENVATAAATRTPVEPSPLQSPAQSRAQTPSLSRRATGTTRSSTEESRHSEVEQKRLPDWQGAGGNLPGAFQA
ncbi:MAG: hypothetical protein Q9222_005603 [Ikaeria aurantiellina]